MREDVNIEIDKKPIIRHNELKSVAVSQNTTGRTLLERSDAFRASVVGGFFMWKELSMARFLSGRNLSWEYF